MASNTLASKSYATSHFQVKVDGHPITSFVKSVEGGLFKIDSVTEPTGPFHIPVRHISTRTVEPITIDIGLSGTGWIMGVLESIINRREFSRVSGEILHCDADTALRFRQEFMRGLITELTLPGLDANSKDAAFVKLKIQPEDIKFEAFGTAGPKLQPERETAQKLWQSNAFRLSLEINGKKIRCEHVSKIEPITVKVGAKAHQRGKYFLPEYIPTKIDFGKMGVTLPLHYAQDFIEWYRGCVTKEGGESTADGPSYEAHGSIEFLDPSRSRTLYTINLEGVAPENFTIAKTENTAGTYKSCKFDLYCSTYKVSRSGLVS